MCTDHSCIENSDTKNKHLIFENRLQTKMNTTGNHIFHTHTLTAHRSALANLIIRHIHLYRAQYSTGRQSRLSNDDQVTCAVGISGQKFIHL